VNAGGAWVNDVLSKAGIAPRQHTRLVKGSHMVLRRLYDGEHAYLLLPAGARGPSFLMLPNFHVIMKYNPAEAYALAIGHLADRLRGGGPLVQSWPRDERALTIAERYELQQLLARRGFDVGEPDGLLGPRSRIAIRNFQASSGQTPDGFASSVVLDRLRQP
jgi:hypothetical protein